MIALARRRNRQKWEFAQQMLVIHLFNHENSPEPEQESRVEHTAGRQEVLRGLLARVLMPEGIVTGSGGSRSQRSPGHLKCIGLTICSNAQVAGPGFEPGTSGL